MGKSRLRRLSHNFSTQPTMTILLTGSELNKPSIRSGQLGTL
jgi:hypothetical protein